MSSKEKEGIREVPFDGSNWLLWKTRFVAWCDGMDYTQFLSPSTNTLNADQVKLKNKLKASLVLSLQNNVLGNFTNEASGPVEGLWNALIEFYERKNVDSKHALREKLYKDRLGDDEDISTYAGRIQQTSQRLRNIGDPPADSDIVYALLEGLPPIYLPFTSVLNLLKTCAFETTTPLKT